MLYYSVVADVFTYYISNNHGKNVSKYTIGKLDFSPADCWNFFHQVLACQFKKVDKFIVHGARFSAVVYSLCLFRIKILRPEFS